MPLRNHFRPPVSDHFSWEGFHGIWPGEMIRCLISHLPEGYTAEPRVHLGQVYELDVNAYEHDDDPSSWLSDSGGGTATATATYTAPEPTLTVDEYEYIDEYSYEVLIFDQERGRQLVAAIEIVSPANKDRPESRRAFVSKCAALMHNQVCVSIVDLVTSMKFNLYAELLALIDAVDPAFTPKQPASYAATCRNRPGKKRGLTTWAYPMPVGEKLPTIPIWLDEKRMIPLELEASYEEACRVLRIR